MLIFLGSYALVDLIDSNSMKGRGVVAVLQYLMWHLVMHIEAFAKNWRPVGEE